MKRKNPDNKMSNEIKQVSVDPLEKTGEDRWDAADAKDWEARIDRHDKKVLLSKCDSCPVCHTKLENVTPVLCLGCKKFICLNIGSCYNAVRFRCFNCTAKHIICHMCHEKLPYERIECVTCNKHVHLNEQTCFDFKCCKCLDCSMAVKSASPPPPPPGISDKGTQSD